MSCPNMQRDEYCYISDFLNKNGLVNYTRTIVAGDASFRKYERVTNDTESFILMIAPPDKEDSKPFIAVDEYLISLGLSAPRILANDLSVGLLLLEDLGDNLYSRYLAGKSIETEYSLYEKAIEVLLFLHKKKPLETLQPYNADAYMREVTLFVDWFMVQHFKGEMLHKLSVQFRSQFMKLIQHYSLPCTVTVLRDYHADNLLWLTDREGIAAVGLLDFQDALTGAPEYDLVSLLEDARRDINYDNVEKLLNFYCSNTQNKGRDEITEHFHFLGMQRNLKIIGIFNRLKLRDNKPGYLKYLPRVWKHLERDLNHPAFAELKAWMNENIPQELRK